MGSKKSVRRLGANGGRLFALVLSVALGPAIGAARATDGETRDFTVYVDNKPAGSYQLTIDPQADGSTAVRVQANVHVRYLVINYRYQLNETELWKDGCLQQLRGSCNDDGKQFEVNVTAEGSGLRVQVNGSQSTMRPDVWTTSYWHLPGAKQRNQSIMLLDSDTGRGIPATLQYVGNNRITVGGQARICSHYRVRGGVQADLWFDEHERLVRQDGMDGNHRTVWELVQIRPR